MVFDLEYGQPAASTTLPTSRPAFRDLLGCFGHADAGKSVLESGVDLLYTSHQVGILGMHGLALIHSRGCVRCTPGGQVPIG